MVSRTHTLSADVFDLWKSAKTKPGVVLTLREAHLLYDLLRNVWVPTQRYDELKAIMTRLREVRAKEED